MGHALQVGLIALGLFAGMLAFLEVGRRLALRRLRRDRSAGEGVSAVDGAVFALLGLLIAFTFSGASTRFEARRHLIVEETNAIGTAYLRLDLLPAEAQPALRDALRAYLDARLAIYQKLPDLAAAREELARSQRMQAEIWREAVAAVRAEGAPPAAAILLLPALNAMFDIATTRTLTTRMHPPAIVFGMLAGLALFASLLAGYGMTGSRLYSWFHMVAFALVMAIAFFVILDLEYPRFGLIRVDEFDRALVELRESMGR